MDKRILKKIAKEWAKGILLATELQSFEESLLDEEEQDYVVSQVHKIAESITKEESIPSLEGIISKYYEIE
jgi:hypothetical protein